MTHRRKSPNQRITSSIVRIKLADAERREHDLIQQELAAIRPEARGPEASALARAMLDAVAQPKAPILEELAKCCRLDEPTLILSGSAKEHQAALDACRSIDRVPLELPRHHTKYGRPLRAWASAGGLLVAVADHLIPDDDLKDTRNVIFFGRQTNRAAHLATMVLLGIHSPATTIQVTHIIADDSAGRNRCPQGDTLPTPAQRQNSQGAGPG